MVHEVIIEIKNFEKDYDPIKTAQIAKSFEGYIKEKDEYKLFNNDKNHHISLLICYKTQEENERFKFFGASTYSPLQTLLELNNGKNISFIDVFESLK
ncbi:UNVERIFIED_CONTAM: hypothetical protein O8I53_09380 [Campylobacter lari]